MEMSGFHILLAWERVERMRCCRYQGCGQAHLLPPFIGLSMRLLETKKGLSSFAFEHSEEYQHTQYKFLAAVDSMEPNNIVVCLLKGATGSPLSKQGGFEQALSWCPGDDWQARLLCMPGDSCSLLSIAHTARCCCRRAPTT